MVTSACIHLRLLNANFLCGAFTDKIAYNLNLPIPSDHVAWNGCFPKCRLLLHVPAVRFVTCRNTSQQ
jgi:hypothetical protein